MTRPTKRALGVATCAFGALILGTQSASAAVFSAPVSSTTQSITVVLSSPDSARLASLAQQRGLSPSARTAALTSLTPSARHHAEADAALVSAGFTITGADTWTITAKAPLTKIVSHFGSRRFSHNTSGAALSYATLPSGLAGLVSGVLDSSSTAPFHRRRQLKGGPDGAQIRSVYSSPTVTNTTGATVATLQFSGWDPANLTTYANAAGIPDPVASGQYTKVCMTSGGSNPNCTRSGVDGGDLEVALDQESLLAVAPTLNQRAYFAPNTEAGEVATLHQVAQDASANHIVAMSVSWGSCEDGYIDQNGNVNASDLAMETDAYNSAVLAGVTVFASTGDAAAFDCSQPNGTSLRDATSQRIDTPASFPSVVGVGGTHVDFTTLSTSPSYETAWATPANPSEGRYYIGDGGGGGRSELFGRPSYQSSIAVSGSARTLPDVASLADPADGFMIIDAADNPSWQAVGGTSLSSPMTTGLFSDALLSAGATAGIGDIHSALYGAATYSGPAQDFRDVTQGDISFGRDPSYQARTGYDLSTGLGAPLWSVIAKRALNAITVSGPATTRSTSVALTITAPAKAGFTQWSVKGLNATAAAPDCTTALPTTSSPPTAATVPGGAGAKVIYVIAKDSTGSNCVSGQTTLDLVGEPLALDLAAGLVSPTSTSVIARWSARPGTSTSGLTYSVRITHSLASAPDVDLASTTSTSRTLPGIYGRTYTITVQATDSSGETASATKTVDVPFDSTHFGFSPGWQRILSSQDFGSSTNNSGIEGATATGKTNFRTLTLLLATGVNNGRVDVYVDDTLVKTIDTYRSATAYRVSFPVISYFAASPHTVVLKVRGDHSAQARANTVVLDAMVLHS